MTVSVVDKAFEDSYYAFPVVMFIEILICNAPFIFKALLSLVNDNPCAFIQYSLIFNAFKNESGAKADEDTSFKAPAIK